MKLVNQAKKLFGFGWIAVVNLSAVILLTACEATDLVRWSPDGKRMAVISEDGILITDEHGKALTTIKDDFKIIRWLPDSTHALAVTNEVATNWKELQPKLSTKRKQDIIHLAREMWTRRSVLPNNLDSNMKTEAGLYLISLYGITLVDSRLKKLLLKNCPSVFLHALRPLDIPVTGNPHEGPVLWLTDEDVEDLRISPAGTVAALSQPLPDLQDEKKIVAVSIKGGAPKIVVSSNAGFPDWTPDSKSLVYISYPVVNIPKQYKPHASDPIYTANLNRMQIADEKGSLLSKFAPPQILATTISDGEIAVRCLPDGSVIFNSMQRTFPTTKVDDKANKKQLLFRLNPDLKSTEIIVDRDGVPDGTLELLETNQSGTRISLAGANNEFVGYLELASGKITIVQKKNSKDIKFAPQWRNNDELCYPARNLNKTSGQHDVDVVLQSTSDLDNRTILSKEWSPGSVDFLNDEKSNESEPARPKRKIVRTAPSAQRKQCINK